MLVLEASARCGAMRGVSADVIAPSHRGQLLDERKVSLLSPMHRAGTDAMFHVKRDAEMCCAPEGVSQQRGRAGDMRAARSAGRVALRGRAYSSTGPRSTIGGAARVFRGGASAVGLLRVAGECSITLKFGTKPLIHWSASMRPSRCADALYASRRMFHVKYPGRRRDVPVMSTMQSTDHTGRTVQGQRAPARASAPACKRD